MIDNIIKVDLACGGNKKSEEYIGVDISNIEGVDIVHNLNTYPWPFEDNSVDVVNCSHYIEHIPHDVYNNDNRDGFIQFMDELYRILKPGGVATISAPYYTSSRAYGDPTHVRHICDMTFFYLSKEWRDNNKLSHYNINCNFNVRSSYLVTDEISLKSRPVQNESFKHDWNVIEDITAELTKI